MTLPPEPRYAEILPANDLISGADIKSSGVVALFKTEPLLAGKCAALLMKDDRLHFPSVPLLQEHVRRLAEGRHVRPLVGASAVHGHGECSLAPWHASGPLGLGGQQSVGRESAQ